MNTIELPVESQPKNLPIQWAEAEWFQVWLTLARRDYQGRPEIDARPVCHLPAAAA